MGRKRPGCCQAGSCIPRVLCWPVRVRPRLASPISKASNISTCCFRSWNDSSRWGLARDKAGNRELFFDQYAALLLLYFFNPVIKSMRALQRSTQAGKSATSFGAFAPTSLGSLSEATEVFTAEHLRAILQEVAGRALPLYQGREAEALKNLCAVDGTVLNALPKMVWALWMDDQHRAAKMHLHFDVLKGVPIDATLTPAACSRT